MFICMLIYSELEDAAQIAYEQRDIQNLMQIQLKCAGDNPPLHEKINTFISALGVRK